MKRKVWLGRELARNEKESRAVVRKIKERKGSRDGGKGADEEREGNINTEIFAGFFKTHRSVN